MSESHNRYCKAQISNKCGACVEAMSNPEICFGSKFFLIYLSLTHKEAMSVSLVEMATNVSFLI